MTTSLCINYYITYNIKEDIFTQKTDIMPGSMPLSGKLTDKDREFLEAVFRPNLDKAKTVLKEGANINAVDEFGYNALFYAALIDDKKMVKFLIKNNCDASLRDAHGWLAWHYSF